MQLMPVNCCLAASVGVLLASSDAWGAGLLPPLGDSEFTVVVLPDTQAYIGDPGRLHYLKSELGWVRDHVRDQRIVFVSHVGDIVEDNVENEWELAGREFKLLHGLVPHGFVVGNHDMQCEAGDSALFQSAFPAKRFEQFDWYGGQIKNNANSYQLFTASSMDFIILHLECNAPDRVLAWADEVLRRHRDCRAIVNTHMYLGPIDQPSEPDGYYTNPKGRMTWKKCHGSDGNTPEQLWNKCFSKHPNLFLVLCGDQSRTQAFRQRSIGEAGNTVHEVLSDYRAGYLRAMRFQPASDTIRVFTLSPSLKALCEGTSIRPKAADHQFTLSYGMQE